MAVYPVHCKIIAKSKALHDARLYLRENKASYKLTLYTDFVIPFSISTPRF
jgi:hypothetical protein